MLTLEGIDKEDGKKIEGFIEKNCNSTEEEAGKCNYAAVECCPIFPHCSTVLFKNKESVRNNTNALWLLAMETCTTLGTRQCQHMLERDIRLTMEGKEQQITIAKDLKQKFENLSKF